MSPNIKTTLNVCMYIAVGNSCSVETTGETGICRLFSDCPGAEELAKKNINVPLCGFHHLTVPIVCCVNSECYQMSLNHLVNN